MISIAAFLEDIKRKKIIPSHTNAYLKDDVNLVLLTRTHFDQAIIDFANHS
jgi:hypothetical protein